MNSLFGSLARLETFTHHLLVGFALVVFFVLDVVFVHFSNTPPGAVAFAAISFLILLSLAMFAGGFGDSAEDDSGSLLGWLFPDLPGSLVRMAAGAAVPAVVVVVFSFLPELEDLIINDEALQLTFVFSLFWILASLALVGVVLGFVWPRTGLFESVLAGGLVVAAQTLITWANVGPPWSTLQLALFNLMIWVSICLAGAWVGLVLREFIEARDYEIVEDGASGDNVPEVLEGTEAEA